MTRAKALCLAALTVWPFLFPLVGWTMERAGLLASPSPEPPLAFIVFMLMLGLTTMLVVALLVFYLVFVFTRLQLPLDHKLVWGCLLLIGHVFLMPFTWYKLIWKPNNPGPYQESTRFSLLVFAPLLLTLLLPLALLFPMAIIMTLLITPATSGIELVQAYWLWVWSFGPILLASLIFMLGKSSQLWFNNPKFNGTRWFLLWGEYSILSMPVILFAVVVGRAMIPSDAPPNTPAGLVGAAVILSVVLQPLVLGWLFAVSRLLPKITPARLKPAIN